MLNQPLLLADAFGTLISALFLIFWIVTQVLGARQEAKQQQKPKVQPRRKPQLDLEQGQPDRQPVQGQPRNQEDVLRSEVNDFLRRAQGKPAQPELEHQQDRQQRQMPGPSDQPPLRPPQHSQRQSKQTTVTPPAPPLQPSLPQQPSLRNEGVAEHVARHLSTQDIAQHAQALGDKVALADDRLESRLQNTFDHSVARMEHQEAANKTTQTPQVDFAAEIATLLHSPQGIRQLIIANEILRRPEW